MNSMKRLDSFENGTFYPVYSEPKNTCAPFLNLV
jgi:hypothetical protein